MKPNTMNCLRRTTAAYGLLLTLVVATMSTTFAAPLCSAYDRRKRACRKNGCAYVKRHNTCVAEPTEGQCASADRRRLCKNHGCQWDGQRKLCYVWGTVFDDDDSAGSDNNESSDSGSDTTDVDVDNESDLIDISGNNTYFTSDNEREPISIEEPSEDESGPVVIGIDRPRPDVVDPWSNQRDPPRPENRGDDSGFWVALIGLDADDAVELIGEEFGNYYRVYICGSHPQCIMRNLDDRRVKLNVDTDNRVASALLG